MTTGEGADFHAARHQPACRRHPHRRDHGARPCRAAHQLDGSHPQRGDRQGARRLPGPHQRRTSMRRRPTPRWPATRCFCRTTASSRPSRSWRSSPTTCVCGHGATVTEIDRNHLFYLMARGIDEKTARGLLVEGVRRRGDRGTGRRSDRRGAGSEARRLVRDAWVEWVRLPTTPAPTSGTSRGSACSHERERCRLSPARWMLDS